MFTFTFQQWRRRIEIKNYRKIIGLADWSGSKLNTTGHPAGEKTRNSAFTLAFRLLEYAPFQPPFLLAVAKGYSL